MLTDAGGTGAMRRGKEILFEGYTEDEILALPKEHVNTIILTGETVVFRAGSANDPRRISSGGEQASH